MNAGWHGLAVVATAGTPVPLFQPTKTGCPHLVSSIVIIAHEDNGGNVVIGPAEDVHAAASGRLGYWELDAGQSMTLEGRNGANVDLEGWWVDAGTGGDSVRWIICEGVLGQAENIVV